MRGVSVNRLDLWVRTGLPHLQHQYPHILGCDGAGEIIEVGSRVDDLEVGSPVLINPGLSCGHCEACHSGSQNLCRRYGIYGEHYPGLMAEVVAVPRRNIVPFPRGATWAEAASVPLTFLTAWQMVVERAKVRPGDTVLVQAGGSGVGVAAIQIAKLMGATVLTTASTERKLELARALGADHAINYKEQDFLAEVRRITDRRGLDVVFDHVGAEVWDASLRALTWGGKLVTCGATSGHAAQTDLRQVFFRQLQILGSTMASYSALFEVVKHMEAGRLRPVVDRTLPFSRIAEAHRAMEARETFGKIVMAPDGTDPHQRPERA